MSRSYTLPVMARMKNTDTWVKILSTKNFIYIQGSVNTQCLVANPKGRISFRVKTMAYYFPAVSYNIVLDLLPKNFNNHIFSFVEISLS